MATIPNQATGLRHVRKTIAFDGSAGNGAVGTVTVFTNTGRNWIVNHAAYCSESIVDAGGGIPAELAFGVSGYVPLFWDFDALSPADGLTAGQWVDTVEWAPGPGGVRAPSGKTGLVSSDLILTVANEAITDGTIIIDIWYYPITDDGALAGDDIDTELGAYIADKVLDEDLSGHTTAGSLGKAVADVEVDTSTTLQAELDGIQADTEDIQTRLPAALVGGRIDATIDATGMEAGAIDAILTRQMTEAYAADGAAPTLAQALFEIMQCLTEFAISGTTITVKKRDGTTTAMTFTLDSATVPTSRTRAT